ncbi:hypothetical protein GCM10009624_36230 [Gordonia sinesedis]
MPLFEDFLPWEPDQVTDLERLIGTALPVDLKEFLLTVGSGSFEGMRVVPGPDQNGLLGDLYSLEEAIEDRNTLGGFAAVVPRSVLIAGGGEGGGLCVGLKGDQKGRVFWANYDQAEEDGLYEEDPPARSERILHELFPTWREFVDDLPKWKVV